MDMLLHHRVFPDVGIYGSSRRPRPVYRSLCMDENQTTAALAGAREQVRHTIERLDEIRADLEATAAGLRLPEQDADITPPLAGLFELDAVIRCVVHDHLKPLIASLRSLLRKDSKEES